MAGPALKADGGAGSGLRIAAYKTLDGIDRVDFALNDDEKAGLAKIVLKETGYPPTIFKPNIHR